MRISGRKRGVKSSSTTLILKWGLVAAGTFAIFAVFGDQGLLKLHQMRQTEAQLGERLNEIRTENDRLAQAIAQLKDDAALEKVVREELGYLRPDEVIYYVGQQQ